MAWRLKNQPSVIYTNNGDSALPAGAVIVLNDNVCGILERPTAIGEIGEVALSGVYKIPASGITAAQGAPAYWDATNQLVKATGSVAIGIFAESKTSYTGDIAVVLNVNPVVSAS